MSDDVETTVARVLTEHAPIIGTSTFGPATVGCTCVGIRDSYAEGWYGPNGHRAHVAAKVAEALAGPAREDEHDDRPDCTCAMTESSLHACDLHGERGFCRCGVPWVDHPAPEGDDREALVIPAVLAALDAALTDPSSVRSDGDA